jgi:hypothetical protein
MTVMPSALWSINVISWINCFTTYNFFFDKGKIKRRAMIVLQTVWLWGTTYKAIYIYIYILIRQDNEVTDTGDPPPPSI